MAKTFLQVRTDERDKEQASVILEELGTNLSSVVNMLLKQIIMTKSIPFEVNAAGLHRTGKGRRSQSFHGDGKADIDRRRPGAVEQVPESGRQRQIQGGDPGRIRGGINE